MAKKSKVKLRVVRTPQKQLKKQSQPQKQSQKKRTQHHPVAAAAFICSIRPPGQPKGLAIKTDDSLDGDLCNFADMTILVHDPAKLIQNSITRFLRRLNVWEYKGPNDSANLDAWHQACGYIHKKSLVHAEATDEHLADGDETVTFACHRYPRDLFKDFKRRGVKIANPEAGIYQVDRGPDTIGAQFIVIPRLNEAAYPIMRALVPANDMKSVDACVEALAGYDSPGDVRYAERIIHYMLKRLPEEVRNELKKEKTVIEALLEFVKPEYLAELNRKTKKVETVEKEIVALKEESVALKEEVVALNEENVALNEEVVALNEEVVALNEEVARLLRELNARK